MTRETDKARWWQFSLSTLLLLTALIAVSIGWWVERTRLHRLLDEARRRIQFLETSQYFDVSPQR